MGLTGHGFLVQILFEVTFCCRMFLTPCRKPSIPILSIPSWNNYSTVLPEMIDPAEGMPFVMASKGPLLKL